ncbi:MAG: LOG family protein [Myxococcota bacterium]
MPQFPTKAYKNLDFLNSAPARHIRILCEYEETRQRFLAHDVQNTIVMFGSARTLPGDVARAQLEEALASDDGSDASKAAIAKAEHLHAQSAYYDAARELSRRLTEWSMNRDAGRKYQVCTGGGPGIMEAGNRGASDAGGESVALGISLPFEPGVNDYATEDLAFEFHYFFTRKLWFLYPAKAILFFPGGFGTMDELFETLTLVQTGKIKNPLPMLLFGMSYWKRVLNMDEMVLAGTISETDPDLMYQTDDVDEAFNWLVAALEANEP